MLTFFLQPIFDTTHCYFKSGPVFHPILLSFFLKTLPCAG